MTDQQPDLDHLDALHAAATPGPWHLTDSSAIVAPLTADEIADVWEPTAASRNGEFIEAAREALPALVDEVRRLRAELATARADTYAAVAVELEGIDFHPNTKATCSDLCRLLAGRFRRKGLEAIDTARSAAV